MSHLSIEQLAQVASGEGDDAWFAHVAACEACNAAAEDQSSIRKLVEPLRIKPITGARRGELAAIVLANAEYAPAVAVPSWKIGAVIGTGLVAAAATVALLLARDGKPARIAEAPVAPHVVSPPVAAIATTAEVVPSRDAKITRGDRNGIDTVELSTGTIAIDARDHRTPVDVRTNSDQLAIADAKVAVRAERGAIVEVRVFAGSVELTWEQGRSHIETGEVWSRPVDEKVEKPPAKPPIELTDTPTKPIEKSPIVAAKPDPKHPVDGSGSGSASVDHGMGAFRAGWTAMRAGKLAEAVDAFDRATDPVIAEDAAYWAAIATYRSGDHAGALRRLEVFVERFPKSPRIDDAKQQIEGLR